MKTIEINLPSEIEQLVNGSVFDSDGMIQDDVLEKFLFYNPEIIRIYGLALADLKKERSKILSQINRLNDDIVS